MSDSDEEELDKETVGRKVNIIPINSSGFIDIFIRLLKSFPQKSCKSTKTYFHFLIGRFL